MSVRTVLAMVLVLGGCSDAPTEPVTLNVYAAASLKDVFTQLGDEFEADHDGVRVAFNFGGSSDLVAQIQQGAPADVFASADEKNMDKLADEDLLAGEASPFASNTLQIVVPADNPAGVRTLKDLASPDVDVVVCAPEVPCGSAATKITSTSNLTLHTVSEEPSVTDVLNKVTSGEADAGLVYVTDVRSAGKDVKGIELSEAATAVNTYPIAVVVGTKHTEAARAFTNLVLSRSGQQELRDAGFGKP